MMFFILFPKLAGSYKRMYVFMETHQAKHLRLVQSSVGSFTSVQKCMILKYMFLFINHSHYKLILNHMSNGIFVFQSKMFLNCCYFVFSLLPLISAYLIFLAFSVSVGDTIIYPAAFIWKLSILYQTLLSPHSYQFSWYLTIFQIIFYLCSICLQTISFCFLSLISRQNQQEKNYSSCLLIYLCIFKK